MIKSLYNVAKCSKIDFSLDFTITYYIKYQESDIWTSEYLWSIRSRVLNARQIRQDTRLKEGGTLRANNGERRDRMTLVTEEIRVHSKAEAARPQDEERTKW